VRPNLIPVRGYSSTSRNCGGQLQGTSRTVIIAGNSGSGSIRDRVAYLSWNKNLYSDEKNQKKTD